MLLELGDRVLVESFVWLALLMIYHERIRRRPGFGNDRNLYEGLCALCQDRRTVL